MSNQEKRARITQLQGQKALARPELVKLEQYKHFMAQQYFRAKNAWLEAKNSYEGLDREEKELWFSLPENQPKKKARSASKTVEQTREKARQGAIAALENLPPEMRAAVLKRFKEEV